MRLPPRTSPTRVVHPVLMMAVLSLWSGAAFATPSDEFELSKAPQCQIGLTKLSYDDPGADDAEFIELHIATTKVAATGEGDASSSSSCHGTTASGASRDAGSSDAAADANAPLTLGDCGVSKLELVDGASGGCNVYRTFALAGVAVPADGYLTICAADSSLAEAGACDVEIAGHSTLKNGWLQNGPGDGLRFSNDTGEILAQFAYEGAPQCFTDPWSLASETGTVMGTAPDVDDVNVFCGGAFVIVPSIDAPLRQESRCPTPSIDAGHPDREAGEAPSSSARAEDAGLPEYAPAPRDDWSGEGNEALDPALDAGPLVIPKKPTTVPPRVSCAVAPNIRERRLPGTYTVLLGAAASFILRRKQRAR